MNRCLRSGLILVALTAADIAVAHAPMGEGVSGGLMHPYLVPAHAMSLVALGLFIGRERDQGIPLLAFATTLIAGLVALTFAVGETSAGELLLGNTALVGLLLAATWTPPRPLGWVIAAVTGAAIALDSPPETVSVQEADLMLLGTGLGALSALGAVVGCAGYLTRPWQRLGVRIVGSWIAASAILVLALTLAR
jgi:urease accessory protein